MEFSSEPAWPSFNLAHTSSPQIHSTVPSTAERKPPVVAPVPSCSASAVPQRGSDRPLFSQYTLPPSSHTVHNGYLTDLPSLYAQSNPGSALWNAVLTCSLASFAQASRSKDMARAAQQQYTNALSSLCKAIEDPALVAENGTLMALLVLDFYWVSPPHS